MFYNKTSVTTKIKYLIALNLVLIIGVFISLLSNNNSYSNPNDVNFAIPDTSVVDRIIIGNSEIKKINSKWIINNKFLIPPTKVKTLLSIMYLIEIKRPVSESKQTQVKSQLQSEGLEVKIYANGDLTKSYWLIGNKGNAYAGFHDSNAFIVHIPGYFIDIPKWYDIKENEWRDKRILYTNWKTLKALSVDYTNDEANSFKIEFEDPFYKVANLNQLDSIRLYNYIVQFKNFTVNEFITDNQKIVDSLKYVTPVCIIKINDIYKERNNSMKVYLGSGKQYGILKNSSGLVELNPKKLRRILINKFHFQKK